MRRLRDDAGDLRGVAERVPYIASLGAEWVWLFPFYRSERRFYSSEPNLSMGNPEVRRDIVGIARFAPEDHMRAFGRGIRRGWAAMLGRENHYRMSLRLLFAAPGTPKLMHGQEPGMGDDLGVAGRNAVRLSMQWTDDRLDAFSEPATLPRRTSRAASVSRIPGSAGGGAGNELVGYGFLFSTEDEG